MRARAALIVPGSLATRTGGYEYDRRLIAGLTDLGWRIEVHELDESFPNPTAAAMDSAARVLARLEAGVPVIVDGLAYGAMPELAAEHARRLKLIALVHHPLALETGLPRELALRLEASERRALAVAHHIVVTSGTTARQLEPYGVAADRVTVIEPGTDPVTTTAASDSKQLELLCVATLVPRKGYLTLIEALAGLTDRSWHLTCVGSGRRDPATAQALRERVAALGLEGRITFTGELGAEALARCHARADVFVLATHHEGYGMALTEAIAYGLPIVSTTAGAVPETLPAGAGLLVPPGDVPALRVALAQVIDEPDTRQRLAEAASAARDRLPTWTQAAARMAAVLEACSGR